MHLARRLLLSSAGSWALPFAASLLFFKPPDPVTNVFTGEMSVTKGVFKSAMLIIGSLTASKLYANVLWGGDESAVVTARRAYAVASVFLSVNWALDLLVLVAALKGFTPSTWFQDVGARYLLGIVQAYAVARVVAHPEPRGPPTWVGVWSRAPLAWAVSFAGYVWLNDKRAELSKEFIASLMVLVRVAAATHFMGRALDASGTSLERVHLYVGFLFLLTNVFLDILIFLPYSQMELGVYVTDVAPTHLLILPNAWLAGKAASEHRRRQLSTKRE